MTETNPSSALRCFVIGPIGNKFAPIGDPAKDIYEDSLQVFENVILPACQGLSIEPVRADQIAITGEINEQIFRHLYEDEIVIADVSGGNANVMYELGLRHTRPLLTIQIGEFGQLPFDVSAVRTIQFSRSDRGLIDARKALEKALEYGLSDPGDGVTATRIWNSTTTSVEEVVIEEEVNADVHPEDDLDADGYLDRIAHIEERLPEVTKTTEQIGDLVKGLGQVATDSSAEISLLNSGNAPINQRLTVVAKFAAALQPHADELTALTSTFLADMTAIDLQIDGLLKYIEENPEATAGEGVDSFLTSITGLTRSSREAMENINQFGTAMDTLAGMSKVLRRPAKQISEAVRTMLKGILLTDAWEDTALRLRQTRVSR